MGTTKNTKEWSKVVSGKGTPSQLLTGVLSSDDSEKKKYLYDFSLLSLRQHAFCHYNHQLLPFDNQPHVVYCEAQRFHHRLRVSTRKHSPEKKVTTTPGHCPGKRIIVTRPTPESSLGTRGQRRKHETPADGTLLVNSHSHLPGEHRRKTPKTHIST